MVAAKPLLILATDLFTFTVTDGITESSMGFVHIDVINSPPLVSNQSLDVFFAKEILISLNGYDR
jgi:hypothetical protein